MFIRFDKMHERDRHTDSAWRHRPRLHSIARQKCSSGLFSARNLIRGNQYYVYKCCRETHEWMALPIKLPVVSLNAVLPEASWCHTFRERRWISPTTPRLAVCVAGGKANCYETWYESLNYRQISKHFLDDSSVDWLTRTVNVGASSKIVC